MIVMREQHSEAGMLSNCRAKRGEDGIWSNSSESVARYCFGIEEIGVQELKGEAMSNLGKPSDKYNQRRKGFAGRSVVERIVLGMFTIAMAAIPVIVSYCVPAPESLLIIKEILQDWCTPSVCFGVLIVGVLVVTSFGGGKSDSPPSTPEQNHKKFADSYLTQPGPVSATQIDRLPDIFFTSDAAKPHALIPSTPFPGQVVQPSSVMVPVYYPAFVPQQQPFPFSSHLETDVEFLHQHDSSRFESNIWERFVPRVDERFVPRVDESFVPRVDEIYEPQEQVHRFETEEEDSTYEPKEEVRYEAYVESRARSDSEVEGRYGHDVEDAESVRDQDEVEPEHEAQYLKSEAEKEREGVELVHSDSEDEAEHYSHDESHVQQPLLPSPDVDSSKVIESPSSVIEPISTESPPEPTMSDPPPPVKMSLMCVERKEAPDQMSPRTPPKHANARRPSLSGTSSSRSYAEFVRRRSIDCPLPRSPLVPSSPSTRSNREAAAADVAAPVGVNLPKVRTSSPVDSKTEAVDETSLGDEKPAIKLKPGRRHSTGGISLMKQTSIPSVKKPREVRVVDDDKLDKDDSAAEDDDVDQRVEAFLKNFREQMRLQRQESLQRHRRGGKSNP